MSKPAGMRASAEAKKARMDGGFDATAAFQQGIALQQQGRRDEALAAYRQILQHVPEHFDALHHLGILEAQAGRLAQADELLRKALKINPASAEAYANHGIFLFDLRRYDDARASYEKAIALKPSLAQAHNGYARVLAYFGRLDEALASYDRAIAVKPDYAEALSNRGGLLLIYSRIDEAFASYQRALAARPNYPSALIGIGNVLYKKRQFSLAADACQRALAINPSSAQAMGLFGQCLVQMGRFDEGVARLQQALALPGADHNLVTNFIFSFDLSPGTGFAEHQRARRLWWDMFTARTVLEPCLAHKNSRDPERRLVIGYVSADFNSHSAAFVFGPVIHNHDKSRFETVCYSNSTTDDAITQKFRQSVDRWRQVDLLSDNALFDQIQADGVDILVDLSGHTQGSRLEVFARKPAPVQVTAWGSLAGTGLPTIDYLFSDPVLVPDAVRSLFAEKVYNLPCAQIIEPPKYDLPPAEPPVLRNGYVTYGVFNRIIKVSPQSLDVWARILAADARSRLIFKHQTIDDPVVRQALLEKLARHGIPAERVDLLGTTSRQLHLKAMHDIDISLDPFPQNGGVSTWEPLIMGVPVVAKLGNAVPSRVSGAILAALGLNDWIAESDDDYVRIALALASDPQRLAELRRSLPATIAASPAGSPVAYTQAVEAAYRTMWKNYCERTRPLQPAAAST
ncbi:MAG: tetratricopeptide repeat protein [Pseudolabrys sp.]